MDLAEIRNSFPNIVLAGIDGQKERIEIAVGKMGNIQLVVGNVKDLPFQDNSFDVSLADAVLYQNNTEDIKIILREMIRVSRRYVFLVETHSEKKEYTVKFIEYNVQDYKKILKEVGLINPLFIKITKDIWPGQPWEYWGYLIRAEIKKDPIIHSDSNDGHI